MRLCAKDVALLDVNVVVALLLEVLDVRIGNDVMKLAHLRTGGAS